MNDQLPKLKLTSHPSKDFVKDLALFLKTDTSVLKDLLCNVDFHWTKDTDDETERLSKKVSLSEEDTYSIISFGLYIFSKLKNGEVTFDSLKQDLEKLGYDKTAFIKIKETYDAYGMELAQKNDIRDAYIEQIFEGTNQFDSIDYKLDYRVITDENKKILDLIPVIGFTFNITTFEIDAEEQPEWQKITFQATEKDLNKIIEGLNEIKTEFQIASEYLKGLKSKK